MENSKYELRDRSNIQLPQRYGQELPNDEKVRALVRRRNGKRSGIVKKIENISKHITHHESRTKICFLLEDLKESFKTLVEAHESLMIELDASDERYNDEYIEEVGVHISNCASCVQSYLETRQYDPPSNEGSDKEARIFAWREALEAYSEASSTDSSIILSEKSSLEHEMRNGHRTDGADSLTNNFRSLSMLSYTPGAKEEILEGETGAD